MPPPNPYPTAIRRMGAYFAAALKTQTSPFEFAKTIQAIVDDKNSALRNLTGTDEAQLIQWGKGNADHEWISMGRASNIEWIADVKKSMGLDVSLAESCSATGTPEEADGRGSLDAMRYSRFQRTVLLLSLPAPAWLGVEPKAVLRNEATEDGTRKPAESPRRPWRDPWIGNTVDAPLTSLFSSSRIVFPIAGNAPVQSLAGQLARWRDASSHRSEKANS